MDSALGATARTIKSRDIIHRAGNEKARGGIEKIINKNKAPKKHYNEGYFRKFSNILRTLHRIQ